MSDERPIPLGYVYRITNKINGKTYVGCRYLKNDRSWRDYLGSGVLVKQAVEKYGEDAFVKSLICYAFDKESLIQSELNHIKSEKNIGKAEYNLFSGFGAGGDTFANLASEDRIEISRRMSIGVRRSFEDGRSTWNKGLSKDSDERLKRKSDKAIKLGTYKNLPKRTYNEDTLQRMSKSAAGNKNSQSNKTIDNRSKIAHAVAEKSITLSGVNALEKHDELLTLDIQGLRQRMSKSELAKHFEVGTSYLTRFFRRHGFSESRTSNDDLCLICEGRKLGLN